MIRIKELRKERGLTLKTVANALNTSHQVISRYELEKTQPDFDTLIRIANYFNVSVDYLLGRTEVKELSPKTPLHATKKSKVDFVLTDEEKALVLALRRHSNGRALTKAIFLMIGETRTVEEILKA